MGQIEKKDVFLIFSYLEIQKSLLTCSTMQIDWNKVIGIASLKDSILLKASDIKLLLLKVKEADVSSIVPTSSTTITLVLVTYCVLQFNTRKNFLKSF